MHKVLLAGEWRDSQSVGRFSPQNPSTGDAIAARYPISSEQEVHAAIGAAAEAADALLNLDTSGFLRAYADLIEAHADELVAIAHEETGLPPSPRLKDVELPRTINQLRQAADAAESGVWRRSVRDDANKIYSLRAPIGPVVVFGPNNFPFAFNSVSGGDFAAAIAARNPVIAKANPGHPGTTRLLAELAKQAIETTGIPPATVQLVYGMEPEAGLALVANPMIGATAFTGSRRSGMMLKEAADRAGKPIYLEMSSINPVVLLKGAINQDAEQLADALFTSCTMGAGQFCTSPGLVLLTKSDASEAFIEATRQRFSAGASGQLLGSGVRDNLTTSIDALKASGAELLVGGEGEGPGYRFKPTLFKVSAAEFVRNPEALQEEAFGPSTLLVVAEDEQEMLQVLRQLEGNLTGTIYSAPDGSDEEAYRLLEPVLRRKVGRLLNDRMPTGVAVSPAMNHGGPFPASGHPGFTAVGIPASIDRFTALYCYDNVRDERLPQELRTLA